MTKFFLTSGLIMAMALPAMAQNRDSDGDVISVIDYPLVRDVYYTLGTDPNVKFRFDLNSPVQGGKVLLEQVSISGTVYRVEKSGADVFLLPQGSNQRIRANLVQASGKRVNPTSFALD